jgi:hypothetical protein
MSLVDKDLLDKVSAPADMAALLLGGAVGYVSKTLWDVLPQLDAAQAGIIGSVVALGIMQATNGFVGAVPFGSMRRAERTRRFLIATGEAELAEHIDARRARVEGSTTLRGAIKATLAEYRYSTIQVSHRAQVREKGCWWNFAELDGMATLSWPRS